MTAEGRYRKLSHRCRCYPGSRERRMPSLINFLWFAAAIPAVTAALLVFCHRPDAPARPPPALDMPAPPLPERYRCLRWRVLVVTPRALMGHQIARMLQGHEVTITTLPEDAVMQAPENDVILYTLAMPGLSGFAFAEQHPELRPCLVFMIESTTSPDLRRGLAVSGVPWVAKPPRYAELATAVDLAARMPREHTRSARASGQASQQVGLDERASALATTALVDRPMLSEGLLPLGAEVQTTVVSL
jgi:CheY-like chemotaxis protein